MGILDGRLRSFRLLAGRQARRRRLQWQAERAGPARLGASERLRHEYHERTDPRRVRRLQEANLMSRRRLDQPAGTIDGEVERPGKLCRSDLASINAAYLIGCVSRLDPKRQGRAVRLAGVLAL